MTQGLSAAGRGISDSMRDSGRSVDDLRGRVSLLAGDLSKSTTDRRNALDAESKASDEARAEINHTAADNTGLASLQAKRANGTLSAADLATAQAVFDAAKTNLQQYQQNQRAYSMEGANSANGDFNSACAILARVQAASGTSAAPAAAATQTVNIVINGKKTAIRTASSADASALAGVLQDLEAAANRAGT